MSPGKTLFRYIARQFFGWCGGVFVAMLSIVFLLDYIELIRRAGARPDATLLVLFEMTALKQPYMAQQIMPFVILFGTMMAFWRLTRSNELVVARAAGVSVWQFLAPPLAGGFLIGVLMVTVFNPVASVMQASYERLDDRILRSDDEQLTLSRTGLWLRQSDGDGQSVDRPCRPLSRQATQALERRDDPVPRRRQQAEPAHRRAARRSSATASGRWSTARNGGPIAAAASISTSVDVPTNLTPRKIQDSFASPETMSFWELPSFIRLLESSGFSALRHRLYFDALLARPLLFAAMVLIAASFSLRMQRRGGTTMMIAGGVAAASRSISSRTWCSRSAFPRPSRLPLAAWTPAGVSCASGR